jgi:hypothetical protein
MRGGRFVPLSLGRRLVVDLTTLHVPSVPVQRVMDVSALVAARNAANPKPSWPSMFAKAYALVAEEDPVLRRAYIKLPSPRLFEYPTSTVSLVVEREYEGEMIVLTLLIRNVAKQPLMAITDTVREAKTAPIESIRSFRRMLDLARWPTPIRRAIWWLGLNIGRQRGNYFGTFGLTVYSGLGAESLHPISPLTGVINYGVIGGDGKVAVRIMYDHRVLDGSQVARTLGRIEEKMNGPILEELRTLAGGASR